MKHLLVLAAAALAAATHVALADVYMHNPRGSNDRGCENNQNRNRDNRLFDSQNNDKGGYACGRAWPFPCYKYENATERAACNFKNWDAPDQLDPSMADYDGVLDPTGTRTPRLYFYEGSILQIEWTMQHGCGENPRLRCDIILQYACEDTLTDDCGLPQGGQKCGPRDGIPVTNSDTGPQGQNRGQVTYNSVNPNINGGDTFDRSERDREATRRIPVSTDYNVQADPRFGRHEPLSYYLRCFYRERNKGLFLADRNLGGDRAIFTRQNNNGNRNGLECPEERDYWPYWGDSPWKDIAILTDRPERCQDLVFQSQNVQAKQECDCAQCIANGTPSPQSRASCTQAGGTWRTFPAYNIAPPQCGMAPHSRENHLGNNVGGGKSASSYNWTIPSNLVAGNTCILRLRYNLTSGDPIPGTNRPVTTFGDASMNGANSPIKDRQNSEVGSYKGFDELPTENYPSARLATEVNTNQFGRTFQDRSHSFSIVKAPVTGECANKRIYNLNVRGKRGNIVQVYPAVEYDFVPNELYVADTDCIHIQWTGSDYGQAQNSNNGFGGPPDPRDNNAGRNDRHNMVQVPWADQHHPVKSFDANANMLSISRERKVYLAFLGQPIEDNSTCMSPDRIIAASSRLGFNNADDRIRYFRNCGALSYVATPYFDGGLYRPGAIGSYAYMDTRNNCFTNRRVTGIVHVQSNLLTSGNLLLLVVGGAAAVGLAGAGFFLVRRRRQRKAALGDVEAAPAGSRSSGSKFAALLPFGRRNSPTSTAAAAAAAAAPVAPPVPARVTRTGGSAPTTPSAAGAAAPAAAAAASSSDRATVIAMYNHVASEPGELSFKKGDQITVMRKDSSGWWEGRGPDGKSGIFPSNYVSA